MNQDIIKKILKNGYPEARLSEDNELFDRAVKCSEIKDNKINPTLADSHYYDNYDIPQNIKLKGFYTGNLDQWIPVLLHDGWLSDNICKVSIQPPKGTLVLQDTKMAFGGTFSDDVIVEEFVVHDSPIKVNSVQKMTAKEKKMYDDIVDAYIDSESKL